MKPALWNAIEGDYMKNIPLPKNLRIGQRQRSKIKLEIPLLSDKKKIRERKKLSKIFNERDFRGEYNQILEHNRGMDSQAQCHS